MLGDKSKAFDWRKAFGLAALIIFLFLLQRFSEALEFQRAPILAGQIWRLWTGHWVHEDLAHYGLNVCAGLVVYLVFFRSIKISEILTASFIFSVCISLALLLFLPYLDWYNGLSGLLHALLAYFLLRKIQQGARAYWLGLVLLCLKLLLETAGASWSPGQLSGNTHVITEAHLIGAIVGSIFAIGMHIYSIRKVA